MDVTWTTKLPDIIEKQLPFGIANGLNDTAKTAAKEAQVEAQRGLNIKSASLVRFFIRAPNALRATKTRQVASVIVGAPDSAPPDRGSVLAQQETPGAKSPFSSQFVAVPARYVLQSTSGGKRSIRRGYELKDFKPFSGPIAPGTKGARKTFIIRSADTGLPVLMQRMGKQLRALWIFVHRSRLTGKLGFEKAVSRAAQRDLRVNLDSRIAEAILSAREIVASDSNGVYRVVKQ
jgi:hypothetical protein